MSGSRAQASIIGYVQAGGASSRFGSDKALAKLCGKTMLERMCDLVRQAIGEVRIVAQPGRYSIDGVASVADRWPGEGPLGGIATALADAASSQPRSEWALILSCDMPFLTVAWLQFLADCAAKSSANAIVPRSENGLEPLCACWSIATARKVESEFRAGTRKVTQALQALRVEVLDEKDWKRFDTNGRLFWNMNTQADYEEACRIVAAENL